MRLDFDSHATTRLDPRVLEVMRPWLSAGGNAASIQHATGRAARDAVERARQRIAAALHCESREILFTSGATESDNLAIRGLAEALGREGHIVTSAAEHRAVLDPVRRLARSGWPTTVVPVDDAGAVDAATLEQSCTAHSRLVSIILASNEVGTINDLSTLGEIARARDIFVHSDASQAVGKLPIDLRTLPVDLVSFTAHKLHGPQGVGALFVRRGGRRIPIQPLFEGGGHEHGLRSGTLPVALIVGFGEAVELAVNSLADDSARLSRLRDRMWNRLASIPDIRWNGTPVERRLPHNLNVSFEDVDGEALLVRVDQLGLDASAGAACSSNNPEPSHVLRAMGLDESLARASLRFGLSRFTIEDEVDRAAAIVSDAVASLRNARR